MKTDQDVRAYYPHEIWRGSYQEDEALFLVERRPVFSMTPLQALSPQGDQLTKANHLSSKGVSDNVPPLTHFSHSPKIESAPDEQTLQTYRWAMSIYAKQLSQGISRLAHTLISTAETERKERIILISLARAGVPIGALLQGTLQRLKINSQHYVISLVLDRGLDTRALLYLREHEPNSTVFFVDGWTGKGAVSDELEQSLQTFQRAFNLESSEPLGRPPRLVVLSDLAGRAWCAINGEDDLIPSSLLGAPICGLLGRPQLVLSNHPLWDRHMCPHWRHLCVWDQSRAHLKGLLPLVYRSLTQSSTEHSSPICWGEDERMAQQRRIQKLIHRVSSHPLYQRLGQIKPGIAEASRAVWRRAPAHVWIRDPHDPRCAPLMYWIAQKHIVWTHTSSLELGAVALNDP